MEDAWIADGIALVEDDVLHALDRGAPPTAPALRFLLRRYGVSDRVEIEDRLGRALAVALDLAAGAETMIDRAGWLLLFGEARLASEDERLLAAVPQLTQKLSGAWAGNLAAEDAAVSIDACLRTAEGEARSTVVPQAIDELERVVAIVYAPGRSPHNPSESVRMASALLTAFEITARLPYAMLAEELVQALKRNVWDAAGGGFVASFEVNCEAACVLGRLAALHRNAEYRAAAIIAAGADYDGDADRMLAALAHARSARDLRGAAYGLALVERLNRS